MLDKNVRLAAVMSIDKKLLVDRLLRGYGLPIDTLETPEYAAFDAVDQGRVQSGEGGRAAEGLRLLARQSGEVHDPDDAAASSPRTTR